MKGKRAMARMPRRVWIRLSLEGDWLVGTREDIFGLAKGWREYRLVPKGRKRGKT